jgi:DNA-binding MarR family transcriptional regulator
MRRKTKSPTVDLTNQPLREAASNGDSSPMSTNEDSSLATAENLEVVGPTDHEVAIHIYRHLIINLRKKKKPPRSAINGPKAAAVLARLRASEDMGLEPIPQKDLAFDLDMNPSDLGQTLGTFLESGMVSLAQGPSKREKLYRITSQGNAALEEWMMDHYEPPYYREAFRDMNPDKEKMLKLVQALQKHLLETLSK